MHKVLIAVSIVFLLVKKVNISGESCSRLHIVEFTRPLGAVQ